MSSRSTFIGTQVHVVASPAADDANYQQIDVVLDGQQLLELTLYADPGATAAHAHRAETAADAAQVSEAAAASSELNAASSESEASDSELNAASSANSSSSSAQASEESRQASKQSELTTADLLSEFGTRFIGAFSDDPQTDRNGDPLQEGSLYWDSTDNFLKVYDGVAWVAPQHIATTAADAALLSESNALGWSQEAHTSKLAAKSSENAASSSEFEAAQSQTKAEEWARKREGSVVEDGKFSSLHYAAQSESSAVRSGTSETKASNSESAALASQTAAALSETNAAASESAAAVSETNAAASESAAAISETNSATSETNANQSRLDAEFAADQAIEATNIYDTISAGLAATLDTEFFTVPGVIGGEQFLILYQNQGGVEKEFNSTYSTAKIDSVESISSNATLVRAEAIARLQTTAIKTTAAIERAENDNLTATLARADSIARLQSAISHITVFPE